MKSIVAFLVAPLVPVAAASQVTVTTAVAVPPAAKVSFTATPLTEYVMYAGADALSVVRSVSVESFAGIVPVFSITTL